MKSLKIDGFVVFGLALMLGFLASIEGFVVLGLALVYVGLYISLL